MKRPLLALLIAFSAAPALHAEETTPMPSHVQDAGWPVGAKGVVRDLKAARLSGSLEAEQLVLIDDVLFLAFRPGRYSEFVELATDVKSIQVIPNGDGTHSLILVKSEGAVLIGWDWDTPNYITTRALPEDFANWKGVQTMWVQETSGIQMLYGYDSGAGKIRRARHCSGVWTMEVSLASHGALRDLAFVELDPTSPGEELVLLQKYAILVMSADGEQLLDKIEAKATDSIAVLRSPSVASADLLVHSYVESGSHYVRVRNSTQSSPGFLLGSIDCTAILPRKSNQFGDHLLLTRGGSGDVDLLEIHSSTGPGGLVLSRNESGAWIDTHEDEDQRPIQAATLVDFDLDGQEDLMVAVLNGNNVELRNVATRDLDPERWLNLESDEPVLASVGPENFELSVTMQVPEVVSSQAVQVVIWARENPGTSEEVLRRLGKHLVTVPVGATEHEFILEFPGSGWTPMESHFELSFSSVEVNAQGEVSDIFSACALAWSAPNGQISTDAALAWSLNATGSTGNSSRYRRRRQPSPVPQPVSDRIER